MITKVTHFHSSRIVTEFAGKDLWKLAEPHYIYLYLKGEGVLCYTLLEGFPTDMRSGSHVIDGLIPKFTNNLSYNSALLAHDFAYTKNRDGDNYISRELADELLYQMVIGSGELGRIRAGIMYRAVRLFGKSSYECPNAGAYGDAGNFMKFRWDKE